MFAVRCISVRPTVKILILLTPLRAAHIREPQREFVLALPQYDDCDRSDDNPDRYGHMRGG
jgi:hypothetical protein